jgi:DNA polymerase-4
MSGSGPPRHILHADLDAFFASVEQLDRPDLRGKPVIVGGSPQGRGVVAACSYEARAFGVHSAMPVRTALRLCPSAVLVSPRFDRYREASQQVMDIFHHISPLVEPLSLDEAYLDITQAVAEGISPVEVGRSLKERVHEVVGLVISVGLATSKTVAKIASKMGKPDGLVVVEPGTERAFLAHLLLRQLPGIGPKTEERLEAAGVRVLAQLAALSDDWLEATFGKRGPELAAMARGADPRPVAPVRSAKSVGAEATFPQDLGAIQELCRELAGLGRRVARRLQVEGVQGRTVTLKLRLSDFTTFTRSVTLAAPTDNPTVILQVAQWLLEREMAPGRRFRLLGVSVSNLGPWGQLALIPLAPGEPRAILSP